MEALRRTGALSRGGRVEGLCRHFLGVALRARSRISPLYAAAPLSLSNLYAPIAFNRNGPIPGVRIGTLRAQATDMASSVTLERPDRTEVRQSPQRALAGWIAAALAFLAPRRWQRSPDSRERLPIYRITRAWEDRWIVTRPGALIGHSFGDLAGAVSFVRCDCALTSAVVELYVGEFYVVAFHDPKDPSSLFGERQRPAR